LGIAGFLLGLFDKAVRDKTFFTLCFWFFSFLGTATGFYFREHYFILVLPAFSLSIGLAVSAAQKKLHEMKVPFSTVMPLLLAAGILAANLFVQRSYFFQMSSVEVSRIIYRGFPFVESLEISKYIKANSSRDARIAVLGSEPEIYFYTHRHSATGYIYTYALMEPQPYAPQMQKEMIHDIESIQPEYLIWVGFQNSWIAYPSSDREILYWFDKYAAEFYERVGVANSRADGTTIYLWNDDAKQFHTSNGAQYISVYRRKSPVTTFTP
jgi:hypothetical protein